jgi:hypothetical protein
MVRIRESGRNQVELETEDAQVLFSYGIPVAVYEKGTKKILRSKSLLSTTTETHVSKWIALRDGQVSDVAQAEIEERITA